MLLYIPVGGHKEICKIMSNAPIFWKNILFLNTISSVMKLQAHISDIKIQLLEAAKIQTQSIITKNNIAHMLCNYDVNMKKNLNDRAIPNCRTRL